MNISRIHDMTQLKWVELKGIFEVAKFWIMKWSRMDKNREINILLQSFYICMTTVEVEMLDAIYQKLWKEMLDVRFDEIAFFFSLKILF